MNEENRKGKLFKSNKELDSTLFMGGILLIFGGMVAATIFVDGYDKSEAFKEIMGTVGYVLAAFTGFFAGRQQGNTPGNGNGEK